MIGTRWMTTLRKLPMSRVKRNIVVTQSVGDEEKSWPSTAKSSCMTPRSRVGEKNAAYYAAFFRFVLLFLDRRTELEDRQVHGDHHTADQYAEDRHDR